MPKDNGHTAEQHAVPVLTSAEQPKRRGRPPKVKTLLGADSPAEQSTLLGTPKESSGPPPDLTQLRADLDEIAARREAAEKRKHAPSDAVREYLLAEVSLRKPVVQRVQVRFGRCLPALDAVRVLLESRWPPVDECQQALRFAERAEQAARNGITRDHIGNVTEKVEALTPVQLQSKEWQDSILREIGSLDRLDQEVEENLATLTVQVNRLKRFAPELVTTMRLDRGESAPPQERALTDFLPLEM